VELVEVIDERVMGHPAGNRPADGIRRSETLAARLAEVQALGLEPTSAALLGADPARAIVDHVRSGPPSLIVAGTHARDGIPRLVLGSVAMELVHDSPVPVVVVR